MKTIRPLAAAVVLPWLLPVVAGEPASDPAGDPLFETVQLEQAGDAGVHTYRIPAMTVARDGSIVIAFDARNHSGADLPGDIDIVVRRSSDNGRSWSPAQRVVDFKDGTGGGDGSLLTDRATGRIFLFYAYAPPGVGVFNSSADRDPASLSTQHPHLLWSDDHGRSWQGPRNLIAQIKPQGAHGMFATSGHGIQLSAHAPAPGRLLQPFAWLDGKRAMHAGNAWSDDHGATWQMGPSIGSGLDENKAVELDDGRVMQNLRAYRKGDRRLVAVSRDGGIHFDRAVLHVGKLDWNAQIEIVRRHAHVP